MTQAVLGTVESHKLNKCGPNPQPATRLKIVGGSLSGDGMTSSRHHYGMTDHMPNTIELSGPNEVRYRLQNE
jgi:hypothetical protein